MRAAISGAGECKSRYHVQMTAMRAALVAALLAAAAGPVAADTFGGFSGVDRPYLVNSDKVCAPLVVVAGAATGSPRCDKATADVVAKLSIKNPIPQSGAKASFAATASGRTLTVTRKTGEPAVVWQTHRPDQQGGRGLREPVRGSRRGRLQRPPPRQGGHRRRRVRSRQAERRGAAPRFDHADPDPDADRRRRSQGQQGARHRAQGGQGQGARRVAGGARRRQGQPRGAVPDRGAPARRQADRRRARDARPARRERQRRRDRVARSRLASILRSPRCAPTRRSAPRSASTARGPRPTSA